MAWKSSNTGSSDVYFDTRTKAVMTHADKYSYEQLKEKIAVVREVVLNKSNDEIVLVLQHFEGDPQKAIQSFTDDGAAGVLNEWSYQGKKGKSSNKKSKKKKSKQVQEKEADSKQNDTGNAGSVSVRQPVSTKQTISKRPVSENSAKQNTNVDTQPLSSAGEKTASSSVKQDSKGIASGSTDGHQRPEHLPHESAKTPQNKDQRKHQEAAKHTKRERTVSEKSTSSQKGDEKSEKKHGSALDKSSKDLQRTTVSLGHHRNKQAEEVENAIKKIKDAFVEAHKLLETREVTLMRELTSIKKQAVSMFDERQNKAVELKRRADQVKFLNDLQLLELRADIKHFVSDRKVDETLGRTSRFQADISALEEQINIFGEVTPITCQYSTRRPSLTSLSSTVSRSTSVNEDLLSPHGRPEAFMDVTNEGVSGKAIPTAVPGIQMTAAEMGELQSKLLESLKAQGLPVPKSPPHRNKGRSVKGPNQNQVNNPPENKNKKSNYGKDRVQSRQQERPNDRYRQNDRRNDRQQNKLQDNQNDNKHQDRQKDKQQNKVQDIHIDNQIDRPGVRQNNKQQDGPNDKQEKPHTDSQTTKTVRRREQYRRRKRERQNLTEVKEVEVNNEQLNSNENGTTEKGSPQTKKMETKSEKPYKSRTRNFSPVKKPASPSKKDNIPKENLKVENNTKMEEKKVESDGKISNNKQAAVETKAQNGENEHVMINDAPKEKRSQRSPRQKPRPASVLNGVILNGHSEKDHDRDDVTNNNNDSQDPTTVKCVINNSQELKIEKIEHPIQNGHINGTMEVDE